LDHNKLTELSQELLSIMRLIERSPAMFGWPGYADGHLWAYTEVLLQREFGGKIAQYVRFATNLHKEATADVKQDYSELVGLQVYDDPNLGRCASDDALSRHVKIFLDLLENHIESVKSQDRGWIGEYGTEHRNELWAYKDPNIDSAGGNCFASGERDVEQEGVDRK
jgi:hypothetical protein